MASRCALATPVYPNRPHTADPPAAGRRQLRWFNSAELCHHLRQRSPATNSAIARQSHSTGSWLGNLNARHDPAQKYWCSGRTHNDSQVLPSIACRQCSSCSRSSRRSNLIRPTACCHAACSLPAIGFATLQPIQRAAGHRPPGDWSLLPGVFQAAVPPLPAYLLGFTSSLASPFSTAVVFGDICRPSALPRGCYWLQLPSSLRLPPPPHPQLPPPPPLRRQWRDGGRRRQAGGHTRGPGRRPAARAVPGPGFR